MLNLVFNMHCITMMKDRITMLYRLVALIVLDGRALTFTRAQWITYAEPEHEDSRRTNFEIVGKINGNILIFKTIIQATLLVCMITI